MSSGHEPGFWYDTDFFRDSSADQKFSDPGKRLNKNSLPFFGINLYYIFNTHIVS